MTFSETIKQAVRFHGIRPSPGRTSGIDAARIAIVLTEVFLTYFSGKIESSRLCILGSFLESDLSHLLRKESFTITPLDREEGKRLEGYNPLKIDNVSEGELSAFAKDVISILKEVTSHAKNREHQTDLPGGPTSHILQNQQECFAGLGR
jgi:hypothetical protein